MPVNGNIDGETGGFQEVGEEVPFDHPRLGDAHLFAAHLFNLFRLFDFLTSSWDEEREEESAVKEFNIASWHPKPLLAFLSFFFTTLGWFSKTEQVEIVHLTNLGVGMNMIRSSQHAATCSLCVMRN